MKCPKCGDSNLKNVKVKKTGVRVDYCPQCRGIWFDGRELESVLQVAAKELDVPWGAEKSGSLSCPQCHSPLSGFQYPQTYVHIDMCKECRGLWLDAGEFNEIKAVRRSLEKDRQLEEYAPPTGIKGGLLRFIDAAIEELKLF